MDLVAHYQTELLFGILLNLLMTFGFGFYKVMNLSYDQTVILMERYPVRPNYLKVLALWFLPYVGTLYIFRELYVLQGYLRAGEGVYGYLEAKLKADYAKEGNSDKY